MSGVNASEIAICVAFAAAGIGWGAIHLMRAGFDYIHEGNNPRGKAMAHEQIFAVGKGALLIIGAPAAAAWLYANVKFG